MNYSNEIAPFYNYESIKNICKYIDEKPDCYLKLELIELLLSRMFSACDMSMPLHDPYKKDYDLVKNDYAEVKRGLEHAAV